MFTGRGWSYSDSRRRRHRGAYRVGGRRGRFTRVAAILVPLMLALGIVVVLTSSPKPADRGRGRGRLARRRAPHRCSRRAPNPTSIATLAPTPVPTVAPTPAPTVPPTPTLEPIKPLLPEHRILAYYGNPLAKEMGILGEVPPDQMLNRLKQQAAAYTQSRRHPPCRPRARAGHARGSGLARRRRAVPRAHEARSHRPGRQLGGGQRRPVDPRPPDRPEQCARGGRSAHALPAATVRPPGARPRIRHACWAQTWRSRGLAGRLGHRRRGAHPLTDSSSRSTCRRRS